MFLIFDILDIGNENDKSFRKLPEVGAITTPAEAVAASDKIWAKIEEATSAGPHQTFCEIVFKFILI